MRRACLLACGVAWALVPRPARAINLGFDAEVGHQASFGATGKSPVQVNRPYAILTGRYIPGSIPQPFRVQFEAAVRGWYDFAGSPAADPRALKATLTANRVKAAIGLQTIAWGESYGMYVADIVNPRDLRDILFNDIAWTRIPVFAANVQLLVESFSLQLIGVPLGEHNLLPATGSAGDFFPVNAVHMEAPRPHLGADSEFGARLGWLFSSGFDASLLFYQHRNRNPVYQPVLQNQQLHLQPVIETVRTVGATFSHAWSAVALRGDAVYHFDTPIQDYADFSIHHGGLGQAVVGADWISDLLGELTLQAHVESSAHHTYVWASFRAARDFLAEVLGAELYVFKGLNNSDLWAQAQLHWRPGGDWTLTLRGDLLGPPNAGHRGMFAAMRTRQRLSTWVSWEF